jgi:hypothetical protein
VPKLVAEARSFFCTAGPTTFAATSYRSLARICGW